MTTAARSEGDRDQRARYAWRHRKSHETTMECHCRHTCAEEMGSPRGGGRNVEKGEGEGHKGKRGRGKGNVTIEATASSDPVKCINTNLSTSSVLQRTHKRISMVGDIV